MTSETVSTGPFIKAAFFCDMVIQGADGTLSAIRIIDRITHREAGPEPPDDLPPFTHVITILIMLVSGSARGRVAIELEMENPSTERKSIFRQDTHLEEGSDRGVNLVIPLQAQFQYEGVHWLIVRVDGRELTRTPLRVLYERHPVQTAGGPPPPEER